MPPRLTPLPFPMLISLEEYSQEAKSFSGNSKWSPHSVLFLIGPLSFKLSLDAIAFKWAFQREQKLQSTLATSTAHIGLQHTSVYGHISNCTSSPSWWFPFHLLVKCLRSHSLGSSITEGRDSPVNEGLILEFKDTSSKQSSRPLGEKRWGSSSKRSMYQKKCWLPVGAPVLWRVWLLLILAGKPCSRSISVAMIKYPSHQQLWGGRACLTYGSIPLFRDIKVETQSITHSQRNGVAHYGCGSSFIEIRSKLKITRTYTA